MSSYPTTYPCHEMPNPYPPSSSLASEPQQPVGFIHTGQGAQLSFVASPAVFPSSQLGQGNVQLTNPRASTAATNPKGAIKILGGIQIVIGIMLPGFGIILALLSYTLDHAWGFYSISFVAGYPFWGGLCFIISGALSISAFEEFSPCLLKGSLGMNIVSCIFSITGATLLLVDVGIKAHDWQVYWALVSGKGISAMLALFSLLEFCIACATAHFATKAISSPKTSVLVVPNVYVTNPMMQESTPAPPRSDSQPPYASGY
ncbi:membrane-spanning 4-domains subfamily A member 12 [Heterocephalus glaber]|uniref:Membrane-spanning 4-domains subfamily A member 12 n=1 Tax=Heterocephalus glaber TaxID=10181 RepID=A0AAX6QNC4_HETGA|nr:membrane-spanning 4-domains subfamily A member 12 [Heterocephalus glaber]